MQEDSGNVASLAGWESGIKEEPRWETAEGIRWPEGEEKEWKIEVKDEEENISLVFQGGDFHEIPNQDKEKERSEDNRHGRSFCSEVHPNEHRAHIGGEQHKASESGNCLFSSTTSFSAVEVMATVNPSAADLSTAVPEGNPVSALGRKRASVVWNHFQVVMEDPCFASCNICKLKVSRGKEKGHLNTSGMMYHLQKHHPLALEATFRVLGQTSSSALNPPAPKKKKKKQQPAPLDQWGKGLGVPKPAEITQRIGEMLALDNQPFALVERAGFRRLLNLVAPQYQIPSRATFSRHVVPSLYWACREKVEVQLREAEPQTVLHFTSDLWTSRSGEHTFFSLTAHWWGSDRTSAAAAASGAGTQRDGYRWVLLHAEVFDSAHSAANLEWTMNRMVDAWFRGHSHLTSGFMVTYKGANIMKAVRDAGFVGVQCAAHALNLVVPNALGFKPSAATAPASAARELIESCWKIAAHFHRSIKGSKLLREKQVEVGVKQQPLVQDMGTRWTSTYLMLQRLSEQQRAVHEVSSVGEIGIGRMLSEQEWDTISQLVVVLKPFLEATEILSHRKAHLSQVIPIFRHLQRQMSEFLEDGISGGTAPLLSEVRQVVILLKEGVRARLEPLLEETAYMVACLCDPRVKGSVCASSDVLAKWTDVLVNKVREMERQRRGSAKEEELATAPGSSRSSESPTVVTRAAARSMWGAALGALPRRRQAEGMSDSAEVAVGRYLMEAVEEANCDPWIYWAARSQMWQDLAKVARQHLSCPPTSVPSERVFSMVGDIVAPHRSCLDAGLVEQLVFLKVNLPELGYPKLPIE
ncbi:zinc finger BED domain-containing protein 4-like [Hemicordylus capensis]|uniref:zinc finger BED domain-containing protein 4-like n=1 Tax=Hemicordylus capensis TaxID=884348 RepID=UPI0023032BB2|nr:zinc finger BED domain-containing protein 4-like [Hemicordylus capensis]XP_053154472.1 zinc finger BED domain-containing protein 4-like [Hemicordylus capensis]XP_053154473.1 zinc finger BED domain-containing protein 4-like [Hemicordylus capensis]